MCCESSGSVVPLFKRQIENGGPVTVTHKEMTRYFMTNIMGATKRIAELILQVLLKALSENDILECAFWECSGKSSGSVVPLFKKQIENGGPVTITHKEMTRYFMTVEEAAQLVLTAGDFIQDEEGTRDAHGGGENFVFKIWR